MHILLTREGFWLHLELQLRPGSLERAQNADYEYWCWNYKTKLMSELWNGEAQRLTGGTKELLRERWGVGAPKTAVPAGRWRSGSAPARQASGSSSVPVTAPFLAHHDLSSKWHFILVLLYLTFTDLYLLICADGKDLYWTTSDVSNNFNIHETSKNVWWKHVFHTLHISYMLLLYNHQQNSQLYQNQINTHQPWQAHLGPDSSTVHQLLTCR